MSLTFEQWARWLSRLGLLVFPATILVLGDVSGGAYAIVALTGIGYLGARLVRGGMTIHGYEWLFFLSVSLAYPAALLTAWATGTEVDNADRFLLFMMSIPLYLVFRKAGGLGRWAWVGLIIGAVVAAAVAFYQVKMGGAPRAFGTTHPIIFGDLSVAMGLLPVAMLLAESTLLMQVLVLVGVVAGVAASMLSKTRGGWVAAMPVLGMYFWAFSQVLPMKKLTIAFAGVLLGLILAYQSPSTGLKQRVDQTVTNVSRYLESQKATDRIRGTSIGVRFEMWQSAWSMFRKNPILGGGWSEFQKHTQGMVKKGLLHPTAGLFAHPHNQFLSSLAKGGLLSFVALLLLFAGPLWIFYQAFKCREASRVAGFALGGMVLLVLYMGFGLSEAIFERSRPVQFFSLYLAIFMSEVMRGLESRHQRGH